MPIDADGYLYINRLLSLIHIYREIAQEILQEYGFLVDTAENGAVAVEKVSTAAPGSYDLVLMDVQMLSLIHIYHQRQSKAGAGKFLRWLWRLPAGLPHRSHHL